jgi:hypothetical protein
MRFSAAFVCLLAIVSLSCSRQPGDPIRAGDLPQRVENHNHSGRPERTPKPVPAFHSAQTTREQLSKTLDPSLFTGSVKMAYQVVQEIPDTIAQLPCYCRCDKSMGHKSLHSCFMDDHAANCGICMNSALKAYKLQKEKKFTPEQIRDELIAEYKNL